MYFMECQCFKHGQQYSIKLSVKALEINWWVPFKMLFSASICQNVFPDVGGDNVLGLCWSITRILKCTGKEMIIKLL